ncbi:MULTISPECIES: globin domain-containing protein [unclassified Rothia (in: high G+C Gram-positive bacteria)]|uniref:globin domain-containing protein n=1 Tax=unclassified Rothia (in: high G+C Gram-positive bacteria) TaxID=2689056 RepID=UPI00195C71F0|nr:globin domain-containing protein [Rothia sp. ZJ932]MBM7052235.1 hemin transporter [Rothia sp. ZJ1223]QRZ61348.1 hemin transporter [Rothia sp. ZJ932]
MLSEKSRPVIEATLPVIAERINYITPEFYKRMFAARPDLMDGMFSRSSQLEGTQPKALAGSIAVFASWIVANPDSYPDEVLSRVAHKHAALGLKEEEYPTVYKYLFEAIAADLGDAATPEVAEAWTEVYWLMADALIKLEKGLYASQANDVMFAPFKVVAREETGEKTLVLTFEPADETPMTEAVAGQYVSIITKARDGLRQPRQFTLLPAKKNQRRVAIKLDEQGEMTVILHELQNGDLVEISNPYGDVTLGSFGDNPESPLYLFSAGIGITPMLAFVSELAAEGSAREVVAVHADRTASSWPLKDEYTAAVEKLENGKLVSFLGDGSGDFEGRVDVSKLDVPSNASVYLCGPLPFMQATRSALVEAGVPGQQIQYEIFGPDQWMLHDQARTA